MTILGLGRPGLVVISISCPRTSDSLGLHPLAPDGPTRWEGQRTIDFFLTPVNECLDQPQLLEEFFSDHIAVQAFVEVGHSGVSDVRFKKPKTFVKPAWLDDFGWRKAFNEAWEIGDRSQWKECCALMSNRGFDCYGDDDQALVDYTWCLHGLQLCWAFRMAYFISLYDIPEDWSDRQEINRVTDLANNMQWRRTQHQKPATRQFPVNKSHHSEQYRKKTNQYARLAELRRHITRGRSDAKTRRMVDRLFGREAAIPDIEVVDQVMECTKKDCLHYEKIDKFKNIGAWRRKMQDVKTRGNWLTKRFSHRTPAVYPGEGREAETSSNKTEACNTLREYWHELHAKVAWTQDQLDEAADELRSFYQKVLLGKMSYNERPALSEFQAVLKSARGAHGLDGWTAEDCKVIAHCEGAASQMWKAMELWEETECTPAILREAKICFIPKDGSTVNAVEAKSLRPICVYPIFYRSWSSTWVRSASLMELRSILPPSMFGSLQSYGPEAMASAISSLLESDFPHGASLDFSHCFDTISIPLMKLALPGSLAGKAGKWCATVLEHWMNTCKWISYAGTSCATPYMSVYGIPQGDAAAPLILTLLMLRGKDFVQEGIAEEAAKQFIYMDDRTVVAKDEATREIMIARWAGFASQFHLLENHAKTQRMNAHAVDNGSSMHVLGALIGKPGALAFQEFKKQVKRCDQVMETMVRLRCAGTNTHTKLNDVTTFLKAKAGYGWLTGLPVDAQCKAYTTMLWKALGRFHYSVRPLRRILQVHTDLSAVVFLAQCGAHRQRNRLLRAMGLPIYDNTRLDRMIQDGLWHYGWYHHNGSWSHQELSYQVDFMKEHDDGSWAKLSHSLRQAIRWSIYQEIGQSQRHEFASDPLPPFDETRFEMVRKLAASSGVAFAYCIGSKMTPWNLKPTKKDLPPKCPCCMEFFHWDHYWTCGLKMAPPSDVLLRRFLWPRGPQDINICERFMELPDTMKPVRNSDDPAHCTGQAFDEA